MRLIFCAGKNPRFAQIAIEAGFLYGAQLPCSVYGPVFFADQDWKSPDRTAYMAALAKHRPTMATVLDWEQQEQLPEVLSWAEEAAQYVEEVLVIPKVVGGIRQLPKTINGKRIVLAYSVPTRYGKTEVPFWEFFDWPVHLLGGSPQEQMRIYQGMDRRGRYDLWRSRLDVVSADGNMWQQQANRCRCWVEKGGGVIGGFVQLRDIGLGDWGQDSNLEAFRRSCRNIMQAWRKLL